MWSSSGKCCVCKLSLLLFVTLDKICHFVLKYRKWKGGGKSTIGTAQVRHPSQYIKHFQCNILFPAQFHTLWMGVSLVSFGIPPPDIIQLIIKKLLSISKHSILFSLFLSYQSWLCFPPLSKSLLYYLDILMLSLSVIINAVAFRKTQDEHN